MRFLIGILAGVILAGVAPAAGVGVRCDLYVQLLDPAGNPLPGASVTVAINGHGEARRSDERGEVRFPSLPSGVVEIKVELFGFELKLSTVELRSGETTRVHFTLLPSFDELTVVPGGWSPGSRLDHEFSGPLATFMSSDLGCDEPDPYWVLWTVPGVQVIGDLSLERDEPLRQLNPGIRLYNEKKFSSALAAFSEVIKARPGLADAYFYRGLVNFCLGRKQDSIADFEKLLALEPNGRYSSEARNALKGLLWTPGP